MFSPFLADLAERAGKTSTGAILTWTFQEWVSHIAHVDSFARALIWAVGTTAWSIACSLVSRHFGRRGTASLTTRVEYAGKADDGVFPY